MANQQINYVYLVFLVIFSAFANNAHAFLFTIGGKNGWVPNPSEKYNHWAERMRFQVNDTLLFKYKNGSDSVLVVSKDEYERCYSRKPILKLQDGNSIFKFNQSGPLFFISGNESNCINGEKVVIVVLAVRNVNHHSPPPAPSPSAASGGSSPPPPHRSFATPPCIPSIFMVSTLSLVLTLCFIIIF